MQLERVSLFTSKRDFLIFSFLCSIVLCYSLLIEYQNYKDLTRFKTAIVDAKIIKQYQKTKNKKSYQVLKLKSKRGFSFYTSTTKYLPNLVGNFLRLRIWAEKKSFYEYLSYFYSYSQILSISLAPSLKQELNHSIKESHFDGDMIRIYQALYTASPLSRKLQNSFSSLGISHLFALSGFHLGVLSTILFFILKYPYKFLQNRYFPYRNSKRDLFIAVSSVLLLYLLFLDSPASLLRAFTMLTVGFILYDRGIKIISMQTLLLTIILLLSFFPKLFFSFGFWLSITGVFYIFLFLINFKHLSKIWQFILVPFWVYLLMLPFSLTLFSNFSIYHPLSIIWTSLFSIFYPLSILLHLLGFGDIFDNILKSFIALADNHITIHLAYKYLIIHIVLSLLSLWKKIFLYLMLGFSLGIFVWAISFVC